VTLPLAGLTVVVTRPARQAGPFIAGLLERGARAVAFPTIAIEPMDLPPSARDDLAPDAHDWVVYTSANAVEHSITRLGQPTRARVAAIGRATARALAAAGVQVDAWPELGADSEGLLAHPMLADVGGRRVLIVKGAGGRDALRAGLAARGARVATVEVYRRERADTPPDGLAALGPPRDAARTVVAATSVEVLESLLELVPEPRVPWLRDLTLLVPGPRVAAAARRLGWRGAVVTAPSAEDGAMLEALAGLGSDAPPAC
jgi:uroporphyrinogen-III synthase